MICETPAPNRFAANDKFLQEATVFAKFLDEPGDESFTGLYKLFTPRLIAFYRARNCDPGLAEDLAQQVMLTVYRKAEQIRDRALFRHGFSELPTTLCVVTTASRRAKSRLWMWKTPAIACLNATFC
jgi:hypothetical protein